MDRAQDMGEDEKRNIGERELFTKVPPLAASNSDGEASRCNDRAIKKAKRVLPRCPLPVPGSTWTYREDTLAMLRMSAVQR